MSTGKRQRSVKNYAELAAGKIIDDDSDENLRKTKSKRKGKTNKAASTKAPKLQIAEIILGFENFELKNVIGSEVFTEESDEVNKIQSEGNVLRVFNANEIEKLPDSEDFKAPILVRGNGVNSASMLGIRSLSCYYLNSKECHLLPTASALLKCACLSRLSVSFFTRFSNL